MQDRVFRRACLGHRGNRPAGILTLLTTAGDGTRPQALLELRKAPGPWAAVETVGAGAARKLVKIRMRKLITPSVERPDSTATTDHLSGLPAAEMTTTTATVITTTQGRDASSATTTRAVRVRCAVTA